MKTLTLIIFITLLINSQPHQQCHFLPWQDHFVVVTMAKKRKLNAGVGAKCSILTKFLHPKQKDVEKDHRTTCILTEMKILVVNRKQQVCFLFSSDGIEYHAVQNHFKIEEEGDESGFFFPEEAARAKKKEEQAIKIAFQEPKKKWRHSNAKQILCELLRDGTIPMDQYDKNGNETMKIEEIYHLSDQFLLYDPEKFEERLQKVRDNINELDKRADEDRKAFDIYKKKHDVAEFTPHGYIQWQGSDAQELIWDDIHAGKLDSMTPQQLWQSREEYRLEFPLSVFRKKIEQEQRTAKYLHTVKVRGIEHKAS